MRTAIYRYAGALAAVVVGMAASASPVLAAGGFRLFGEAIRVHPGHDSRTAIQLRSTGTGFGGIDFTLPSGLTFAQVTNLGTDYDFTAASCGGGAPRFQINIQGKNAFVYIGPPPNYTGCPASVWASTGNLATPPSFVDTSQLAGGTFYDTFASADLKYGSDTVTGIQLVTDAGWMFGTQTVLVDNVMINAKTYTFESCKHGDCERDDQGDNPDNSDED
jgi:hypothetical protein